MHFRPHTLRATVPATLAGERLDKAIPVLFPAVSRTKARTILTHGGVWQGDRRIKTVSMQVTEGMELVVVYPPDFVYPSLTLGEHDILWEDEWLLALRKQAGWYVQPTAWDIFGNVEHALHDFLRAGNTKGVKLHLTHRLDRETSGVLIVSKRPEINGKMQRLWSTGGVEKRYLALVAGAPASDWTSDEPLGPGPNAKYRVDRERGRAALTLFTVLSKSPGEAYAEVEAEPKTGRTHQIRIHAAHHGHPLLGDVRYGGPAAVNEHPVERVMLHSRRLAFRHPVTGAAVTLEAEPPADYVATRSAALSL
jgi:23S rRNA pseudouridine1911/1915/1917 synthase